MKTNLGAEAPEWAATSNWGRWGPADERGALNHITPSLMIEALKSPTKGRTYSLGMEISNSSPSSPIRCKPWHSNSTSRDTSGAVRRGMSDDTLLLQYHGSTTHIDALSHMWYGHHLYNGFEDTGFSPNGGATRCAIEKAGPIVGRGVLLDLAGYKDVDMLPISYAVTPEDIEGCCRKQGIAVRSGDIVLMRTGWLTRIRKDPPSQWIGEAGPGLAAHEWLFQHQVSVVGADNVAVECTPPEDKRLTLPFHIRWLRDVGGYIIEFMELDELAKDRVYEFLFVALPLRIAGGVGSPINPVAIV